MAAIRRLEAKERKARRNRPKQVSPESVISKLIGNDSLMGSGAKVEVWLEDPNDSTPRVCSSWFRTEECTNRKCRLSHECPTIARLRNVAPVFNRNDEEEEAPTVLEERACLTPVGISSIISRDYCRVMIVSVDNECVFDYGNNNVWLQWLESHKKKFLLQSATRGSLGLPVVKEEHSEEDSEDETLSIEKEAEVDIDDIALDNMVASMTVGEGHMHRTSSSPSSCGLKPSAAATNQCMFTTEESGLIHGDKVIPAIILSLLSDEEVVSLMSTCKGVKACCLRDEVFRQRRREGISAFSHEQSRRKKDEKKKRIKSANAKKTGKKDGFARGGGNGGR
jgi:hypothetical protein